MTSVLYDVPGPRAVLRNRVLGVATVVVVAVLIALVVWRLAVTGQFSAAKWSIFTYTNVWVQIGLSAVRTLAAFAAAGVGAIVLGFVLAIARLSEHQWVRIPATVIVEVLRAVPVLIFMMLLYYGLPVIGIRLDSYWAVVIALVAYNGSVLAEVIRAGVVSLPGGQSEAGYAIGLRKSGVMRLILLPQALRAMMPVVIAQLVVTLKDTALGFIITYPELLYYAKLIGSNAVYGSPLIPAAIVSGSIYIALCLGLSYLARVVERRTSRAPGVARTEPVDPRRHEEQTVTQVLSAQIDPLDVPGDSGPSR